MQFIISHAQLLGAIAFAIVSEMIAVRQQLNYPENSGVGGVLAAALKLLQSVGAKDPKDLAPPQA